MAMDFGYSFTSANNLQQLNGAIKTDYYTNAWGLSASFSTVQNIQDDVKPIKRSDGAINLKIFFAHDYYGSATSNFYGNNEQNLSLRSTYNLGLGRYFIRTNRVYLSSTFGIGYTFENYMDTLTDRKSVVGSFGIEYNVFDMGDLNLYTKMGLFPSFSEKGRLRSSFDVSLKYDLPKDFYIKLGLNYKYDTKPIQGISPQDYVYNVGIGWEL